MLFCGLKLTHDGSVAVIQDDTLLFSYEVEKFNNNKRYSEIPDLTFVEEALALNGYTAEEVEHYTIDGWAGLKTGEVITRCQGEDLTLMVAPYREAALSANSLFPYPGKGLKLGGKERAYTSYLHSTTHLLSTYCASPFALRGEDAYLLVYDGGMYPRLYYFNYKQGMMENLGPIFMLIGNIYSLFALHFEPFFQKDLGPRVDDLSVAGKVMAYIATGNVKEELMGCFERIYREHFSPSMEFNWVFSREIKRFVDEHHISHADALASFHLYMERLLVDSINAAVRKHGNRSRNFCFIGGCSLNIKWNSAIRSSGIFDEVFISPFTNDTGSAIGAACCEMYRQTGNLHLKWSVYSGPSAVHNDPPEGWSQKAFSIQELARLLHETNEPVVVLNGRAELGPRALGNRSILATAIQPDMKDRLNVIKQRELYRPVSPICIEERAPLIFEPGTRDPYMLFDHILREPWSELIPAIRHLDGSARLQTVSKDDNPVIYDLLCEYEKLSGIPVLCNTSANLLGSGFFPDVRSATEWNGTGYVWCDGNLYYK
ncbi:carbamoyltransferase N-terminal domain-containing protein [Paenibacillus sp. FSL H8-0332]|uniref:carbamoyltransferase N-terminal domain-containing protein n=1 Tax=Paenibacillus sp. FSL H8-0332 TaxID=2954742 RepID=UPI0030CE0F4F